MKKYAFLAAVALSMMRAYPAQDYEGWVNMEIENLEDWIFWFKGDPDHRFEILRTDLINLQKDIDNLKDAFKTMREEEGVKDAQAARRRILRFNDELLRNVDHSKEYFDDILEDVRLYDVYCSEHKDFTNGKTVMATKNIKRCYENCMEKHSFLN